MVNLVLLAYNFIVISKQVILVLLSSYVLVWAFLVRSNFAYNYSLWFMMTFCFVGFLDLQVIGECFSFWSLILNISRIHFNSAEYCYWKYRHVARGKMHLSTWHYGFKRGEGWGCWWFPTSFGLLLVIVSDESSWHALSYAVNTEILLFHWW